MRTQPAPVTIEQVKLFALEYFSAVLANPTLIRSHLPEILLFLDLLLLK